MKKNIMSLLTIIAISSTMCLPAFATVTANINDGIIFKISSEAIKNINVENMNYYKINREENSIDYYSKNNNIKFIFNEEIDLNDKAIANNMIEAITNRDDLHEHDSKLIGSYEIENKESKALYYCEDCNIMLLGE